MVEVVFNHATLREKADMPAFLDLCAARGLNTVSIWGDEIGKTDEKAALQALRAGDFTVSGYNRIGPFTPVGLAAAEGELERAVRCGADHVLVFTGGFRDGERDLDAARNRVVDTIADLLEQARRIGATLALEPLHPMLAGDRTLIASLTEANDICDSLGAGIGVVVDVYHVWWDARLASEIARAGRAGRILGFHVNDWLVPTRDLLTDRGMMGDGVIDLAGLHRLVRDAGFSGPVEVEIFSSDWWSRDPAEVIDTALRRCRDIFG